jgi:hypothetical protein
VKGEILFRGDRTQVRAFIAELDRSEYKTLRGERVDGDLWQVVVVRVDDPTPEEIAAMVAPLREYQKKHPRYTNELNNRPRGGDYAAENYQYKRVSMREENIVRVPQGWRP